MIPIEALRLQIELWQARRTTCELSLELCRRDLAALEREEAERAAAAEPETGPA